MKLIYNDSKNSTPRVGSLSKITGLKPVTLSYPDCDPLGGYGKVIAYVKGIFPHRRVDYKDFADIVIAGPGDGSRQGRLCVTFWESSKLCKRHVNNLNEQYSAIAVTAKSVEEAFRRSGVTLPIYRFPLAVDWEAESLPPLSPFIFVSCSTDSGIPHRKRVADIVTAFKEEFQTESDVRLLVKRNPTCTKIPCYDTRVEFVTEILPDIRTYLRRGHCGVFCSGMEGWGLPAHELLALGRPSLLPLAYGFAEFCTHKTSFPLVTEMRTVPDDEFFHGLGKAPFASIAAIRTGMRYVYENRDEVIVKAGECVKQARNFRFAQMQSALINIWQQVLSKT